MQTASSENEQIGMPGYTAFLPGACTHMGHASPSTHSVSYSFTPYSHTPANAAACSFLPHSTSGLQPLC